jgi:hypothetical protein
MLYYNIVAGMPIWEKKGIIVTPEKSQFWNAQYCMVPTPVILNKDIIRVYYATTGSDVKGRITYIDLSSVNPSIIVNKPDNFILDIGSPGCFDDSGVIPSFVEIEGDVIKIYYIGFKRTNIFPYTIHWGIAEFELKSHNLINRSTSPYFDASDIEYCSNSAPAIFKIGDAKHMVYWAGTKWSTINNKQYISAGIKSASLVENMGWISDNNFILLPEGDEFSLGRPWVMKYEDIYHMWYSRRLKNKFYRLGYAISNDGINWVRKDDDVGIDVSKTGWDSDMICYSSVIKVDNNIFMFYNGNNHGEMGFGFAQYTFK